MSLKTAMGISISTWFDFFWKGGPHGTWVCLLLFFQLLLSGFATSHTVVTKLPGFSGDLPFTLETGYIGVGELEDVHLFYYFVQSQRTPSQDPLMLWLSGGPGCSGMTSLFYESGPLNFVVENYNGSAPTLKLNDYAWTQTLNMIYIDAPIGAGFSYSTTTEGYYSSDTKSVAQLYQFLGKWLLDHPQFALNNLYIGGESYSGIPVPMLVQEISDGIKEGHYPSMNIKGYVLVNPKTDTYIDNNERIPFAYGMSLISKEIYEATKESCNGNYVNTDSENEECLLYLQTIEELVSEINLLQILEPACTSVSLESSKTKGTRRFLRQDPKNVFLSQPKSSSTHWCREYSAVPLNVWANEKAVQEALNVRNGTIEYWQPCNSSIEYTTEVDSTVDYHRNLTSTGLRALIFSGDHDMSIPSIATQAWITALNITLEDSWRSWSCNGQTAGYTKKYTSGDFTLTYATIKGAGHIAPEYKPEECYVMMDRWLAYYPL